MPLLQLVLAMGQFAPSVMRFFGAGQDSQAVAEKVAGIAQVVTGTTSPQEALDALKANGQAQVQFAQAVLAQDGELEAAYLADRKDARARDIALRQAGQRNTRADLMVLFDVIGLIACLLVLALVPKLPPEVTTLLSTIAGIFGLCLRDAHQFEFGSSRGSRNKDEQIAVARLGGGTGGGA